MMPASSFLDLVQQMSLVTTRPTFDRFSNRALRLVVHHCSEVHGSTEAVRIVPPNDPDTAAGRARRSPTCSPRCDGRTCENWFRHSAPGSAMIRFCR